MRKPEAIHSELAVSREGATSTCISRGSSAGRGAESFLEERWGGSRWALIGGCGPGKLEAGPLGAGLHVIGWRQVWLSLIGRKLEVKTRTIQEGKASPSYFCPTARRIRLLFTFLDWLLETVV